MMTDPNHSYLARFWLTKAEALVDPDDASPAELALIALTHAILGIDDGLAGEEQYQSEKFESTSPLGLHQNTAAELDEDNPDTLAEDDTVESPRFHGIAYHDDNGAGYEPVSAAAIHRHDHPGRTDFYGTPGPWDAA